MTGIACLWIGFTTAFGLVVKGRAPAFSFWSEEWTATKL